MSVYVREGFLTPAECDAARALFPAQTRGAVNTKADQGDYQDVRRSRIAFLPQDTPEQNALACQLLEALDRANRVIFSFEITDSESLQLATYDVGDEYGWHLDIGPGEATRRKLSASVQLSNPASYDGGDLEIWGSPRVDRSQGSLIIFPSYMLHKVWPVTRGVRHSLVAWARGKNSFR
jgi:PKHD-type hydroxylase